MATKDLSDIEVLALSKCVKDKLASEARSGVPENSAHSFGFDVRVSGTLTRACGTPPAVSDEPASVELNRSEVWCGVLRELGIGPTRFGDALKKVAKSKTPPAADEELVGVMQAVATAIAAKLPSVHRETPGRSGAISVVATVTKL